MSGFSITGAVVKVGRPEKISEKFSKAELWLAVEDGRYTQTVCIEAHNDRADLLHGLMEGEVVTAHFDIRGRQWQEKVFNTLALWKVEQQAAPASSTPAAPRPAPKPAEADVPWEDAASLDLPF